MPLQVSDGIVPPVVKDFRIWTADFIAIPNDVEIKRQALINYIWGANGWPTNRALPYIYSLLWSNPTVGTQTLSAVATDDRGGVTTSETALLTVLPLNQAPIEQWLSPTDEIILQEPQPAAAPDLHGTVVQREEP